VSGPDRMREALRVLRGMSDYLADAVLDGVKPDDIGQPDWDAANDAFRVALATNETPDGKRVRADVCPVCGGSVLAPESLTAHVWDEHPEQILPNGETVNAAIARLAAYRAGDPWQAGWNAAVRWMQREPLEPPL
jgi:hypothetical protein